MDNEEIAGEEVESTPEELAEPLVVGDVAPEDEA